MAEGIFTVGLNVGPGDGIGVVGVKNCRVDALVDFSTQTAAARSTVRNSIICLAMRPL